MKIEVLRDAEAVARRGAALIAAAAREAIAARGRFVIAVSGGHTPWRMLRRLAAAELDWRRVHVVQVDERVAPAGSAERNLTQLEKSLFLRAPLRSEQVHPMPVDDPLLDAAAKRYAQTLERLAGTPLVLDLIQLGLGLDGHTASLVPADPVLHVGNAEVAVTGMYEGRQRMTLTFPIIDRARCILWLVTGAAKAGILARFVQGDTALPACRVSRERAVMLADRMAASRYWNYNGCRGSQ